jgi:hypothetical protein
VTRHLSFIPGLAGATVEEGIMTGNLPALDEKISSPKKVNMESFIDAIAETI